MTHIVIGGGIMGLLTAYYLDAAGEKVILVEQGKLGRESSWAGGGILSPLYPWRYPDPVNDLAAWSQRQYPELVNQLAEKSGIDAQWIQSGMLVMDPEEMAKATGWADSNDVNLEIISDEQSKQLIPGINDKFSGGSSIWMPDIAQVRNPRLLKALIKTLRKTQVEILEETPVTDLCIESETVVGVRSNNQTLGGDSVTVACGAWSSEVLRQWLPSLNVEPVRGQMILYKASPQILNPMILKDSHYLIPRKDGRIIVGSTLEFVGFNKEITEEAKQKLSAFANDLLPTLKNYPIEHHWSGLRPGNSVQIPFISKHPNIEGLFVNTGHYRNGVVTAPASAMLCVDLILSRPPILEVKSYSF